MKTHKIRGVGIVGHLDGTPDTFKTWCGISDLHNPTEEFIENLVPEYVECTCKRCRKAYENELKLIDRRLSELEGAGISRPFRF